jgi:aminoglycoside phosphotransferase (APT) family kinase protein
VEAVELDSELVSCLLREQFPQWASQWVRPVEVQGWDNRTFRVGEVLAVRLPSAEGYAGAVGKEQRWLPVLAPQLPVPIPVPVAQGRPGCGLPWPWSVYRWLPGEPAQADRISDPVGFALELAAFLTALQGFDATGGPAAGPHSFWRGGPLSRYDAETRVTAAALAGLVDLPAVLEVWEAAVSAPYTGRPVWVHGDVTGSNLLVEKGRLAAVIDFGSCAVGDPACDLVIAWTLLDGEARRAFQSALPVGEAAWTRARGWALWKALLTLAQDADGSCGTERRYGWRYSAHHLIDELLNDKTQTR